MFDTIIIGGGPSGLTAAIYLLRACKKVLVIEKEHFGGAITKASRVENYPGFSSISGLDLGNSFYEQAKKLGMESIYGIVSKVTSHNSLFEVSVGEQSYRSKTLILATGTHPRSLEILEAEKYIGRGLSYCATCDGGFFKDKNVCVVGGGNTAIDDALYLSNICKQVTLIHRREEFRAEPIKLQLLKERKNVSLITNGVVSKILGDEKIEKVIVKQMDKEVSLDVEGIFVAIGSVPNTMFLEDFISLNANGYVLTNHQLETSVPGFYVAGDVREKEVRQLTTATSDGTIVALKVIEYLDIL